MIAKKSLLVPLLLTILCLQSYSQFVLDNKTPFDFDVSIEFKVGENLSEQPVSLLSGQDTALSFNKDTIIENIKATSSKTDLPVEIEGTFNSPDAQWELVQAGETSDKADKILIRQAGKESTSTEQKATSVTDTQEQNNGTTEKAPEAAMDTNIDAHTLVLTPHAKCNQECTEKYSECYDAHLGNVDYCLQNYYECIKKCDQYYK